MLITRQVQILYLLQDMCTNLTVLITQCIYKLYDYYKAGTNFMFITRNVPKAYDAYYTIETLLHTETLCLLQGKYNFMFITKHVHKPYETMLNCTMCTETLCLLQDIYSTQTLCLIHKATELAPGFRFSFGAEWMTL